jgi:hypothetical protein
VGEEFACQEAADLVAEGVVVVGEGEAAAGV